MRMLVFFIHLSSKIQEHDYVHKSMYYIVTKILGREEKAYSWCVGGRVF